jgi:hypothetical protein
LLGYGGSESLEAPKVNFSKHVWHRMKALGVHLNEFDTAFDKKLYASLGLTEGVFFDRETFGVDRLVSGNPKSGGADPDPGDTAPTKSIEAFVAEPALRRRQEALDRFPHDTKELSGGQERRGEDRLSGSHELSPLPTLRRRVGRRGGEIFRISNQRLFLPSASTRSRPTTPSTMVFSVSRGWALKPKRQKRQKSKQCPISIISPTATSQSPVSWDAPWPGFGQLLACGA